MKKLSVVLVLLILSVSLFANVSADEVYGIPLKHSTFKNVEVLNNSRNVVIHLAVSAKATEHGKVPSFVLEDSKQIFSYFKKKYTSKDYDVVDIMFYMRNYQFANANAWSDTIQNLNISKLNLNTAKSKLDVWECKW